MRKSLKVIIGLCVCALSFGLIGANNEGTEVPGTRKTGHGGQPPLQPGRMFTVDMQNRIYLTHVYSYGSETWFIIHSDDFGQTWSEWAEVPPGICNRGVMTCDSPGNLYVASICFTMGLFFTSSEDGGIHWSDPKWMLKRTEGKIPVDVTLNCVGETLYLAYLDQRASRWNNDLYFMISHDRGETWSDEEVLWNDSLGHSRRLAADVCGSEWVALWYEWFSDGEYENMQGILYLRSSEDGGKIWSPIRYPAGEEPLYVAKVGANIFQCLDVEITPDAYYVSWDSSHVAFFASSSDKGVTWTRQVLFEADSSRSDVELDARGNLVAALVCADGKSLLRYSIDRGESWSEPKVIGQSDFDDRVLPWYMGTWEPRLAIDKDYRIHALWHQAVDTLEAALFYYCETETAIEEAPSVELAPPLQAFPNPFRDHVNLVISLDPQDALEPAIYDAAGRLVRSFGKISPGNGLVMIDWNGRDAKGRAVPKGSYFVRVRRGEDERSLKIVRIR
ncbi:MAG: FlgD immunoglobulin-like domain containing protein [candidate division WOR-3 bacterium]|nr:FlgD immunoglobulin-like domain containing protein [candidate division WOR-3 bacterium]